MQIGLSSIIQEGFGSGSFVFGEVPSGPPSYPAAGTILNTLSGQEYPIGEGGGVVTANASNYPNQVCDVYVKADGSGGSYYDWVNVFNVQYKMYGDVITSEMGTIYVNINAVNYPNGDYGNSWYHDGSGSYYTGGYSNYSSYGSVFTSVTGITSYISIGGSSYANGSYDEVYRSDGSGSYYSTIENISYTSNGTFIVSINNQVEVPYASSNYYNNGTYVDYSHDGSGGTTTTWFGSYYSYGTYITNYSGTDYYWDGNGSFYY